jgi:phosphogluconate dehydratase
LEIKVDEAEFNARPLATQDLSASHFGLGRELFSGFRAMVGAADKGANALGDIF